jgi:hypothetical protein
VCGGMAMVLGALPIVQLARVELLQHSKLPASPPLSSSAMIYRCGHAGAGRALARLVGLQAKLCARDRCLDVRLATLLRRRG